MTKKITIGGFAALSILLVIVFGGENKSNQNSVAENESVTNRVTLVVRPQTGAEIVNIEAVTLTQSGFLAIRAIEGNRLGQIIEISEYLPAGKYNNVSISLGDFYEGDDELIVMVYEDAGNDQIFNDLDQPYEENGVFVAVYLETGEVVPESIVSNYGTPEGISLMDMGSMQFISYTDSGFEPKDVTITRGTMVHFINDSQIDMWVASDDHPAHTDLPTFDQFKGSPPGGQYVYIFDQAGEWKYHDHLTPTAIGTITVTN